MRTRPALLAAAATLITAATTSAAVTTASADTARSDADCHVLAGHTFLVTTDVGFDERMSYDATATQLTATVTQPGPFPLTVGTVLTEKVSTAQVAEGVYLVSWVEPGGFTVSEAQNLHSHTVQLFWTYPDGSGNQLGESHTGTVTCLAR